MKVAVVHNRKRDGVIGRFGRPCPERYSLRHVQMVADALRQAGHDVALLPADVTLFDELRRFLDADETTHDVADGSGDDAQGGLGEIGRHSGAAGLVFNMAYGIQGDARYTHLPAMLELAGVPYTGSNPLGHALALDKVITKILLMDAGVPTPAYQVLGSIQNDAQGGQADSLSPTQLRFPLVVKPRHESTSYSYLLAASGGGEQEMGHCVTVVVARETEAIDATLSKLAWILASVASATTFLILGALVGVIHRSLKPVARLAGDIDSINEDQLDARLNLNGAPNELLPVVKRLNNLLGRLHAAFEREKSFTADAAHELRTPLAGLRSTLEVSLSRQRSTDAYRQAMEKCLAICRRMQSDVESLLTLARLDGTAPAGSIETVHVASVLRNCWDRWAEETLARDLVVQWQLDESLHLRTDAGRFPMMIDNLLGNAVAHSNQAGFVRIESALHDDEMTIRITNSGSQIDAKQIARVFEPFWRGDTARSAAGAHAGLGLTLCKKLADSLGFRIAATLTQGDEFSVCLYVDSMMANVA